MQINRSYASTYRSTNTTMQQLISSFNRQVQGSQSNGMSAQKQSESGRPPAGGPPMGPPPMGPPPQGGPGRQGGPGQQGSQPMGNEGFPAFPPHQMKNMIDQTADYLGTDVDSLREDLKTKTISEIVQSKNRSLDDLKTKLVSFDQKNLDAQMKAGSADRVDRFVSEKISPPMDFSFQQARSAYVQQIQGMNAWFNMAK